MEYALESLNELISVKLKPQNIASMIADISLIDSFVEEGERECQNIQNYLMRKSTEMPNEERLRVLVQQHQSHLIRLIDIAFGYISFLKNESFRERYEIIIERIKDLILHLEKYYCRYFDHEQIAPAAFMNQSQNELARGMIKLKKKLPGIIADPDLIDIVLSPIVQLVKGKSPCVSFSSISYLKNHLTLMEDFCNDPENKRKRGWLKFSVILIYSNFNSDDFFCYLTRKVRDRLRIHDEPSAKYVLLTSCQAQLYRYHINSDAGLNSKSPLIKDQLCSWLDQQIHCQNAAYNLGRSKNASEHTSSSGEEDQKIEFGLSVEALGIFIRSAQDAEGIKDKNQSELLRKVAKYFRTKNTANIYAQSLQVKSYTAERRAKQAVEKLLLEMLKMVRGYAWVGMMVGEVWEDFWDVALV